MKLCLSIIILFVFTIVKHGAHIAALGVRDSKRLTAKYFVGIATKNCGDNYKNKTSFPYAILLAYHFTNQDKAFKAIYQSAGELYNYITGKVMRSLIDADANTNVTIQICA